MSEVIDEWAEKIILSVKHLQLIANQAADDKERWIEKCCKLTDEYEGYVNNIERKHAEKRFAEGNLKHKRN